jgi:hypothetical protein
MKKMLPRKRAGEFILKTLADGIVVYDRRQLRAHSLNRVSAAVFEGCDGSRDVPALQSWAGVALGAPVSQDVVELALGQLTAAGLIEADVAPATAEGWTRREVMQTAMGTALSPVIASIDVPDAGAAASGQFG